MEFKRWHTIAALTCSLSLQAIALAEKPAVRTVIGTLVSEETENPTDTPPNAENAEPGDRRTRLQLPNGDSIESGHITIQLPNGETKVIRLTNGGGAWTSPRGDTLVEAPLPKFVIGVSLSEVPESLRAHIALPDGAGVMVGSIVPDSPASKSELQQFDILLKSGDKDLKHPKDLQELVDASEGKPVSITLQRKGESKTVEVTPLKREDLKFPSNGEFNLPAMPGNVAFMLQNGQLPPGMALPYTGPNPIVMPFPSGNPHQMEALTESIRNLSEQIERLKGAVDRLEKNHGGDGEQGHGEKENNRAKDDGDCWKVPRRNRLTTLISIS
jgi:PDZ domain